MNFLRIFNSIILFFALSYSVLSVADTAPSNDPNPDTRKPISKTTAAYKSWLAGAEKGDANAQYNLALIYEQGTGIKPNLQKAVFWYRKAAKNSHTIAQYNIGTLLHFGKGLEKNELKAALWYEKAAKKGHIAAQSSLAYLYLQSSVKIFRDTKKSAYWYARAAKLGYPEAQFNLGLMYSSGRGVLLNYKQAYAWFDLAQMNKYKNALKSRDNIAGRLSKADLLEAQQLSKTWVQLYFRRHP